jgi:hypothetical protein
MQNSSTTNSSTKNYSTIKKQGERPIFKNSVFTESPYTESPYTPLAKKVVEDILNVYTEAVKYGIQKGHEMKLDDVEYAPTEDEKYKEFETQIYNQLYPNGITVRHPVLKEAQTSYYKDNTTNFVAFKAKLIGFLEAIVKKYPKVEEMLYEMNNVSRKDFEYTINKENEEKDTILSYSDNNFLYFILDHIIDQERDKQNKSKNANGNKQSGGKTKVSKTKVCLKENRKEYLVHVNDKKEKFIKKRGEVVFLRNIRGKYNNVK